MLIDLRPILVIIGRLLLMTAAAMCVPAAVDLMAGSRDWSVFVASAAVTVFSGMVLIHANRDSSISLTLRQAFLLTTTAWLVVAGFGALPFYFSELDMSATDALFESMSGITTTGSSVIARVELAPPGILVWRAMLQWLGGIGIIVLALVVLPLLKIGGMQMFRIEGAETSEKALPRTAQLATAIGLIYVMLTAAIGLGLFLGGMNGMDSVIHAMTTISTGGFSTAQRSLGAWDSPMVHWVAFGGMVLGGMPFVLFLSVMQGLWRPLWRDEQVRWYLGIMGLGILGTSAWLFVSADMPPGEALRHGSVTVASFMTGTGFFTVDYSLWSGLPIAILFFLTFVGGCAGSTAAGIKVFRFQILAANARAQTSKLLRPHSVRLPYYNGRPIPEPVADSVMGFLFVYVLVFAVLAMLLGMMGLDLITALSAAASAISNVGPGLGATIGPAGSYATLPDAAKWLLTIGMLMGRLEMFAVLVLFVPSFWKP